MFSTSPFKSILDLLKAFPNEQSCIDYLEEMRWDGNVISPFDKTSKVYKCKNNRYKCFNTNRYFNVRTGTIFEGSKIPLQTWFLAIYLFTSHKRGISSYQMAKDLNVTQKTAWFLLSRIRYSMEHENFNKVMEGTVESDETFIGGKNKNRHKDKKVEQSQGRSFKDKTPALGLLQREEYHIVERPHKIKPELTVKEKVVDKQSIVKCKAIPDTKASTIQPLLLEHISKNTRVMTDEWLAYTGISKYYDHGVIDHGKGQYADGDVTTNRIENFWSHLKRSIIGMYYNISRKHIQKYLNELSFRFNTRYNSVSDIFNLFLQTSFVKRLTYQNLIYHDTEYGVI